MAFKSKQGFLSSAALSPEKGFMLPMQPDPRLWVTKRDADGAHGCWSLPLHLSVASWLGHVSAHRYRCGCSAPWWYPGSPKNLLVHPDPRAGLPPEQKLEIMGLGS